MMSLNSSDEPIVATLNSDCKPFFPSSLELVQAKLVEAQKALEEAVRQYDPILEMQQLRAEVQQLTNLIQSMRVQDIYQELQQLRAKLEQQEMLTSELQLLLELMKAQNKIKEEEEKEEINASIQAAIKAVQSVEMASNKEEKNEEIKTAMEAVFSMEKNFKLMKLLKINEDDQNKISADMQDAIKAVKSMQQIITN